MKKSERICDLVYNRLYPSESDDSFQVITVRKQTLSASQLTLLANKKAKANIEEVNLDDFIEKEGDFNVLYKELKTLNDLIVYKISDNGTNFTYLVVGDDEEGTIVLKTTSVET